MRNTKYTKEINTELNFSNITVYNTFTDGIHDGYEARPDPGYVMYSPSSDVIVAPDPITGAETTEIYYCTMVGMPLNFNFDNFDYIVVSETECEVARGE